MLPVCAITTQKISGSFEWILSMLRQNTALYLRRLTDNGLRTVNHGHESHSLWHWFSSVVLRTRWDSSFYFDLVDGSWRWLKNFPPSFLGKQPWPMRCHLLCSVRTVSKTGGLIGLFRLELWKYLIHVAEQKWCGLTEKIRMFCSEISAARL